jgi:putative membrane protein
MLPMKTHSLLILALLTAVPSAFAADVPLVDSWHARTPGQALVYMLIFAAVGIAAAIIGYKIFDKFTPGELHKEIVEKQNVAAAIIGAAVVIGICIIVAAAMIG